MSYCRFSTNDYLCDLYAYERNNGIQVYVAQYRPVYTEALPAYIPLNPNTIFAYVARCREVRDRYLAAEKRPIGLNFDGESFLCETRQEFLEVLLMLKADGYNFPDDLIPSVEAEINDADN